MYLDTDKLSTFEKVKLHHTKMNKLEWKVKVRLSSSHQNE